MRLSSPAPVWSSAGGSQGDRAALEGQVEWLAVGSYDGGGAHADERIDAAESVGAGLGQWRDVPPVIELAGAREVGARLRLRIGRLWCGRRRRRRARLASAGRERTRFWRARRRAAAGLLSRRLLRSRRSCGIRYAAWLARRRRGSSSRWRRRRRLPWRTGRRRHVHGEGRRRGSACGRTSTCAGHCRAAFGDLVADVCRARRRCSCFTSQGEDRVELHGAADGGGASGEGHEDGNRQNDGEEHGLNGNLRIEDRAADLVSEERIRRRIRRRRRSAPAARLRRRRERRRTSLPAPRAFISPTSHAAFEDGGGHGGGDGQRRGEQRGQRDQQHQSLDAREYRAFVLRDLANLLGMRVRDRLPATDRRSTARRASSTSGRRPRDSSFSDRGGRARLRAWSAR